MTWNLPYADSCVAAGISATFVANVLSCRF